MDDGRRPRVAEIEALQYLTAPGFEFEHLQTDFLNRRKYLFFFKRRIKELKRKNLCLFDGKRYILSDVMSSVTRTMLS